jgi:DNA-binding XRE family transcriptional regulator
MPSQHFPTSQGQLIRAARGEYSQAEFARRLGVHRSCLSRYESEALGAPTAVLNVCLRTVAEKLAGGITTSTPLTRALSLALQAVEELKAATRSSARK